VIKDLVTSGASMLETIELLNVVELKVTNVVVFINREQRGSKLYRRLDYISMSPFKLTYIVDVLMKHGKVVEEVIIFVK